MTTLEANKALVRRIFEEVIPAGDTAAMRELVSPDWVDHDPLPGQPAGPEGPVYVVSTMNTRHPDLRFSIDDLVAEADRVVIRWTLHGTVELAAVVIFRIADGKLAERWAAWKPGFDPAQRV